MTSVVLEAQEAQRGSSKDSLLSNEVASFHIYRCVGCQQSSSHHEPSSVMMTTTLFSYLISQTLQAPSLSSSIHIRPLRCRPSTSKTPVILVCSLSNM